MLKSKKELIKELQTVITEKCIGKRKENEYAQSVMRELNNKYKMTIIRASDIVSMRIDFEILTEFELFCVCDIICPERLTEYFVNVEIQKYSNSTFEVNKIFLPLKISMIKVQDNQFIGAISAKTLREWGDAGFINYNQNTQRTLKRIVRGDKEYYKISLNQTAINAISKLMEDRAYISDDITLNIPDDDESSFSYNSETKELRIDKLKAFDIIDGYHRYVSIVKMCNLNLDFDYPMEIRITNYTESKAQQFIWQKDQKTKMKKLDSDSLNQERLSNRVVNRLNDDPNFIWYRQLDRNNPRIPVGTFALAVDKIFFTKKIKKDEENLEVRKIANQIKSGLETYFDQYDPSATKEIDDVRIVCILYCIMCNGLDMINEIDTKVRKGLAPNASVHTILRNVNEVGEKK